MKINFKSRGFTLIELLVVISIIVIMTGIILNNLSGSRAKARDAQRISDLGQLQLALALFVDRCGEYPSQGTLSNAMTSAKCPNGETLGTYIQVPKPPAGASQNDYDYTVYRLKSSGYRVNYVLHAKLEKVNAASSKGLDYSAINDPTSASPNEAPYGWGQAANSPPYSNCSSGAASLDYCVGPN